MVRLSRLPMPALGIEEDIFSQAMPSFLTSDQSVMNNVKRCGHLPETILSSSGPWPRLPSAFPRLTRACADGPASPGIHPAPGCYLTHLHPIVENLPFVLHTIP
ncbi:hypothetical protein NDU88_006841 [Pleurodeles waltl]|uniref:Uncharacterized protein n=1 Tax=Pleurodeles waltl TaxID=8319 RepID=A0AAV7LT34_PLEWA|nr:hypothetical protein NDU88_006841 [Pleurodeles waltl]